MKIDFINLELNFILDLYKSGIFFMGKSRQDDNVYFVNPAKRALLPIKDFHCPKSLISSFKKKPFRITINTAFKDVIKYCAFINRQDTWINKSIEKKFIELHISGHAHSVECWKNQDLVGGIYGLSIGRCFFAESMFSKISNSSKIALLYLVSRLYFLGYKILDVQFINSHLTQFGVFEISRSDFKNLVRKFSSKSINFNQSFNDPFELVLNFLHSINTKS